MYEFQVGDNVVTKNCLEEGKYYGELSWHQQMKLNSCRKNIIRSISLAGNYVVGRYTYSAEMLELAEKSKVEQIAEILGVEIGEKFNLRDGKKLYAGSPYMLDENLQLIDEDGDRRLLWQHILKNYVTIEKIPQQPQASEKFKPKDSTGYYLIKEDGVITFFSWDNDSRDLAYYAIGNCFPTREAAEAAKPEILAKFEEIRKEIESED